MIHPLNPHYSMCNPGSVFDEEALTALELAARTAKKVNECVGEVNQIPVKVSDAVQGHIDNGAFDQQIDTHTKELTKELSEQTAYYMDRLAVHAKETNARISALATLEEGSTTGDAELIDGRIGHDGTEYPNLGASLRAQFRHFNMNLVTYNYYLEIDTTANTATFTTNSDGAVTMSVLRRNSEMRINMPKPTPVSIDMTEAGEMCFLWLSMLNPDAECPFFATANRYITPGPTDVLLAVVSGDKVYPVSLSGANIKVNGKLLHEMPTDTRMRPYSSGMVVANGKVKVDLAKNKITIPKGAFISFPLHNDLGTYTVPNDIGLTWEADGLLHHVIMEADPKNNYAVGVVDRRYVFQDGDVWLGYVYNNTFTPVELPYECVDFGRKAVITGGAGGRTTMEDYFQGLMYTDGIGLIPETGVPKFKIVLAGDSITHGVGGTGFAQNGELILDKPAPNVWYRNPNGVCWANYFKAYIEGHYHATVTNNGCTGMASDYLNDQKDTLIPAGTDLAILTIGTNNRGRGNNATECAQILYDDLCAIVDYCHGNGTKIILCTCIPASASNENGSGNRWLDILQVNAIIKKVCAEYNLECADIHNGVFFYYRDKSTNYFANLPDGLHPNDALYRTMYFEYLRAFRLPPHYSDF